MSDFLGRLAQRVIAPRALLQPRLPSLFEEAAAAEPMREETTESVARPVAAVSMPTVALPRVASLTARETNVKQSENPQPSAERVEATAPRALEPRVENERQPRPTIVREVLESIPMEIAANADLAVASDEPVKTSSPPPAQAATAQPRIVTRRAVESRRQDVSDAPADVPPQTERDVRITIGRIDVRAVTPPARERPAPKASRTMTLDDYLSQRGRR